MSNTKIQHQPFENGLDEFPNHSSNSESLKRIREEQPQEEEKEEKEDEQTSSSSSLALTTIHQDEAAVLHALVASSLYFNGLPTVTLFMIMGFVDSVDGGLSRLMSLSSSMHRVVNILLERLSNQVCFAVTTSGRRCLKNTMELLRMLSKRGNGYDMARRTVSLVLAEGVHVVGPGILTVPHVNLSIGIKEQEEGKEKDKVDIIGGLSYYAFKCKWTS